MNIQMTAFGHSCHPLMMLPAGHNPAFAGAGSAQWAFEPIFDVALFTHVGF